MLVLSRTRDESVLINDNIEVRVIDVRGDKVRLGFIAPRTVSVHRKEIYDLIHRENKSAAELSPADVQSLVPSPGPSLRIAAAPTPDDEHFMREAFLEAKQGLAEGGLPIGSVLVRKGLVIGRGHNRRVQDGNPMAHAEIDCLTRAGRQSSYKDTVLYSTLMPCFLCSGAAVQFQIPRVVVGESVTFPGGHGPGGSSPDFMHAHGIEVIDLHDAQCIDAMSQFIRDHGHLWNEDIGR